MVGCWGGSTWGCWLWEGLGRHRKMLRLLVICSFWLRLGGFCMAMLDAGLVMLGSPGRMQASGCWGCHARF